MAEEPSILSLFQLTDEQKAAATSLDGAISVQAGAGSGKTRALVGRFLALLESGLPLRSLVAITFTEKAAREMRNRIRGVTSEWLAHQDAHQDALADQALWNEVFSALDSARISTIHGLCATILRAHPAEAGVDPVFGLLEEGQSAVWQARAVEAALVEAVNDEKLAGLFRVYQEGQVRRMVGELLARRLDVAPLVETFGEADSLLGRWGDALAEWFAVQVETETLLDDLATLESAQSNVDDDKLEVARRAVLAHWADAVQAKDDRDWAGCFQALAAMRKATAARGGQKGNWDADDLAAAREAMKAIRAAYEATAGKLIPRQKELRWDLDQQAAGLLPLVRGLFLNALAIYQSYKDDADVLDFDDLEQMTARLLREHQAIRQRWQQEINAVLLVDEFQDTNERQREIVYALVGFQDASVSLRNSALTTDVPTTDVPTTDVPTTDVPTTDVPTTDVPTTDVPTTDVPTTDVPTTDVPTTDVPTTDVPTSLFVVGDAKQSIYRFRGADVAVFRQVQDDIRNAGGALIDFDLTFRAHKVLLDLTNDLLEPIMSSEERPERPYDVPFAPLKAFRKDPRAGMKPPYFSFELGLGENKAAGRAAAAAALAGRLQTMQAAGEIEWKDVALLFRSSTAYGIYEDALEQLGIPYVTIAGRGFYQRPEIRDLLNVLAAIADPTDDLAMAGYLRSPAIGCSDAMIHKLRWGADGERRSFVGALRVFVGEDLAGENYAGANGKENERETARFALDLLDALSQQAGRVSVAHLLKLFLDRTHYRSILRLVPKGERLRRNVDKLLDAAHRSQLVSVSAFLEYVELLRDVGARESEAPTEAGGAVQLMTIHRSKGLEFPVVVLADAGYTRTARSAPFYLDRQLGLVLNPPDEDGVAITYRLAAWQETEQEGAESRRLLYVAATRAMEKLIISGDARRSTAKASPGKLLMAGWLQELAEVVGFADITLDEEPETSLEIPLDWGNGDVLCRVWAEEEGELLSGDEPMPEQAGALDMSVPILLAPISTPTVDERVRRLPARSPEPAARIWQVVTAEKGAEEDTSNRAHDWLVDYLTHVALRYWRLPDSLGDGALTLSMRDFWRPFALEAGVTESPKIEAAMQAANRLLSRFSQSELYEEIQSAERHHHVAYSFVDSTVGSSIEGSTVGSIDGTSTGPMETVSGVVDLLYRQDDGPWTVVEVVPTRLAAKINVEQYVTQMGYDRLIARVGEIVERQVGERPTLKVVFLDVGGMQRIWQRM